ncbi:MAG: preprotein translocase subunit YajC [Eubacteriales bacterium]|nr:preprotein translocase subunit YajC [Eubacteriales bacterium]
MNLLLSAFGDWMAKNWMILVLIVLAIALLVPTYLRQKKEVNARNELNNTIKKGTKIITTAGVYGVVESIEDTTDGKVVTIVTGNTKNPTTMTIHINAIGGIDNKTPVVADKTEPETKVEKLEKVEKVEVAEEPKAEKEPETQEKTEAKKPATKKTTKKSTK